MIPLQILVASVIGWGGNLDGVVLDFSAKWCGPCQQMSPIVARLERQGYPVRKVDIDAEPELARRFNVQRIPTFVLVIDGQEQARHQGLMSEDQLKRLCSRVPKPADTNQDAEFPVERPADKRLAVTPAAQKQEQPAVALAETPAPRKPGFRLPFLGGKKEEAPARDPREGAISRGNIDDRAASAAAVTGDPMAASVRIRIHDAKGDSVGSGTVIDSRIGRTLVLTCGHIFRHWDKQSVIEVDYFSEGRPQTVVGRHLSHDLDDDVGLIVINVDPLPSCPVAALGTKVLKGAPVISVGCSHGNNPTVQSLRITALNRYLGADNIECSGVPVEGRSGGGLFTQDGRLIGVCNAAAPHNKEGLYAGLKTVQSLLERCELAHLYRPRAAAVAGPGETEVTVAELSESEMDKSVRRNQKSIGDRVPTAKTEPAGRAATKERGAGEEEEVAFREALEQAGEAEVVCIIRPVNQPRAASRVVILNRASRRFVEYLSDEVSQDDIRLTSLTGKSAAKKPLATQQVKRQPTPEADLVAPETKPRPQGPQAYRRSRSAN